MASLDERGIFPGRGTEPGEEKHDSEEGDERESLYLVAVSFLSLEKRTPGDLVFPFLRVCTRIILCESICSIALQDGTGAGGRLHFHPSQSRMNMLARSASTCTEYNSMIP